MIRMLNAYNEKLRIAWKIVKKFLKIVKSSEREENLIKKDLKKSSV